jgi:hypothetical protein
VKEERPAAGKGNRYAPSREETNFSAGGFSASAGGLQTVRVFLIGLPSQSGIVCVIGQHLAPNHKEIMPGILQGGINLKGCRAEGHLRVESDRIHTTAPHKNTSISHGSPHFFDIFVIRTDSRLAARTKPYRTRDNRIDEGAATFTDMALAKERERKLRRTTHTGERAINEEEGKRE